MPSHRPRLPLLLTAACLAIGLVLPTVAHAQSGSPKRTHEGSFWAGLMTDWTLRGPYSLWFDTHYDVGAFMVLRSGLTYRFEGGPAVTGGYAHLWTDPGNGTLQRNEHRPWAQVFLPFSFSDRWSVSQRLRFDLRVRQRVQSGEVVSGWIVVPRWRSQTAASYWLKERRDYGRWFFQTACELLINGSRTAGPNFLDQNRLSLMVGLRTGSVTVRVGYLDRFVPGPSGQTVLHEHDAVVWLNYRFHARHPAGAIGAPEAGNP